MSKFLSLVEENTPGKEQPESLADKFHRFADRVSALEEGRDIDIDELLLELNALNEELTTKGGVPEAPEEDFEITDKGRQKKLDKFDKNVGNMDNTLIAAQKMRAADPDPKRPSRGVQKINKEFDKMGKAVAKNIARATKMMK
jgi:hypothetical protein